MASKLNYKQIVTTAMLTSVVSMFGVAGMYSPVSSYGKGSVTGEVPGPVVSEPRKSPNEPDRRNRVEYADTLSPSIRQLFNAIRQHESVNGTILSGDDGASLGEYHIGRDYWQDAVEYGGVDWDYDTYVWSANHCRQIMLWYWARYGARTLDECARMHNGGLSMQRTDEYWQTIKAIMEKESND